MSNHLKKIMEEIKKPTLKFDFSLSYLETPRLDSYIGGKPYILNNEEYPVCKNCKKSLDFMFQLYIPKEKDYFLYTFYFCNSCDPFDTKENFNIMIYKNPELINANFNILRNQKISHMNFNLTPSWSFPEFETLEKIDKKNYNLIKQEYKEEAWMIYENLKDELEGIILNEPFSFFEGYPQFFSDSSIPKCKCCNKYMNLWLQFDSNEENGINWANTNGSLFIFKCNESDNFKIFIQ